jgi:phosphoserine phosphatase
MTLHHAAPTSSGPRPVRAVVCDLDHTLTARSSMVELCRALHAPPAEVAVLFRRHQAGELDHDLSRETLLELLRRSGRAHRQTIEVAFHDMAYTRQKPLPPRCGHSAPPTTARPGISPRRT